MSIQELATIQRLRLPAVVVVVDNGGYSVERAIHGPTQPYNDIARWDWTLLPQALGPDRPAATRTAITLGELSDALNETAAAPNGLWLIQAVVPPLDVPPLLESLARAAGMAQRPLRPAGPTRGGGATVRGRGA